VRENGPAQETEADDLDWVFAENAQGDRIRIDGRLVDGFYEVTAMYSSSGQPVEASRLKIREACLNTVDRMEGDQELMLGWAFQ
jgi:hypothetical protein